MVLPLLARSRVAQRVGLGLQLLGQVVDFVAEGLELLTLGVVLSFEVGKSCAVPRWFGPRPPEKR